eukprot:Em0001g1652a
MTELERERRPTRFSACPPPRFATGTDFSLWIKRVELYIQEAGKKAGLKLKPSKCHILKKCVHYLGHIVSADGVKVDDDKIKCIVEWPTPVNLEELRRFLGIASCYRKFIKGFAHIAVPLHALTEKLKPWEWTGLCDEAFAQLKTKLSSPPILSFPQFNMQFTVDCDASLEGLGAVLSQENDRCVVAYASRVLTKQERQYCATRREMLALIWAIQYFKPYLWGRPFKVRTDHSALKWLKNFKDPHGQVARWLEILSEYDFTVEHRPGLKHGNADSLSRLPCRQCGASQDQVDNLYSLEAALAQATESDLALWLPILTPTDQETLQNNDPALAQVMVWVESNSFPKSFPKDGGYWLQTLWAQQKYLVLQNGVLYRRWEDIPGKGLNKCLQFVLPQDLVPTVLEQLHNAPSGSHLGVSKTVEKVRRRFYWPGQRRDIERWCAACESCATRKAPPTKPRAAMQADLPSGPFERVAMDILGPLPITTRGNKYILVVGDYFTKWVESFPLASIEAEKLVFGREVRLPIDVMFGLPPHYPTELNKYAMGLRLRLDRAYRQTDDLHVARPDEELPVEEENGDIDGDIPAEASETDDEINSNIDREIPAETSESDDEIETEEPPVDQGDHLQVAITDDEPNERIEVDNAAVSFTAGELNGTAAMEQAPDPAEKR